MELSKISLKNIMGIEEFTIDRPGEFTLIRGANGRGKSSLIEALKSLVGNGQNGKRVHDATLLRRGETEGELVIELGDETIIRRSITEESSELTVHEQGKRASRAPTRFVDDLLDALAFAPIHFLNAPPSKQAEWLLETMPPDISIDAIRTAAGRDIPRERIKGNNLDTLAEMYQLLYDERTGVNRLRDDKRGTADELTKKLGTTSTAPDTVSIAAALDAAKGSLASSRADLDKEFTALAQQAKDIYASSDSEIAREQQALSDLYSTGATELRAAAQRKIDAINMELAKDLREIDEERNKKSSTLLTRANEAREDKDRKLESLRTELSAQRANIDSDLTPKIEQLTADLARVQAEREQWVKDEEKRKLVDEYYDQAVKLDVQAAHLADALVVLEELKIQTLLNLPIPGLAIEHGEVVYTIDVHGKPETIPFARVNTAQKFRLVLKIAELRAKTLPIICMDGIEALDGNSLAALENEVHALNERRRAEGKDPLYFIGTRVSTPEEIREDGGALQIVREEVPA